MTVKSILTAVAGYYGIPESWICSNKRSITSVKARRFAAAIAHRETDLSLQEIAELMGVRRIWWRDVDKTVKDNLQEYGKVLEYVSKEA